MTKSLIISVSPEEALNILNEKQTLLLHKRVPKGFRGWCYCYIAKGKPRLAKYPMGFFVEEKENSYVGKMSIQLNQTIPFRFWFDEYEVIKVNESCFDGRLWSSCYEDKERLYDYYLKLNLTESDFHSYSRGNDLYAWHINQLEILDKPMMLGEFCKVVYSGQNTDKTWFHRPVLSTILSTPPKTYQYVWVKSNSRL